ncbi:inorganic triphosphatase YgiF [Pseudomonas duriflava]|uniref:Inorganic triphosphatase YgiF n=1 Tax=Pseudomonas duriflava TaxID=459528 RepID=A0A562QM88_9PSED|nr:inorganic triphosphatase [Pseudomonas duriflava]TWI57310.1 inorganic triphosphatase YgiF [Pseudomonas duriflava]
MAKETEIKLRASRETLAALRAHPLLNTHSKEGWERSELLNQYYDTDTRELAHARVALRVRRDGDRYIQTLKSRGQSMAGLSERNEWEWPLETAELDTSLLGPECWPEALAHLDKRQLKPIFTTDFTRERTLIAWEHGNTRTALEAALDLGQVVAGEYHEDICELELELREGEPATLLELAEQLAADLPLMPCDISKAERGYRLHDSASYTLYLTAPTVTPSTALDTAFSTLAWHLLGSSQRLAEQYRWNGHWRLLVDWVHHLVDLRALLGSLGQAVPRSSSRELRQALDTLLLDWKPLATIGQEDEEARQQAPARFAAELEKPRWGHFSLLAARWLHERTWTTSRNARGNTLGERSVGKWLLRTLAEEAAEIPLQRALNQPSLLADQLPRIERMLVWLRLARPAIELPEIDRLYGEMAKLPSLIAHDADEALGAQAHTLITLASWKALLRG